MQNGILLRNSFVDITEMICYTVDISEGTVEIIDVNANINMTANSIISADESVRQSRKSKILQYWKMYLGSHWEPDELETEVPTVVRNKVKIILNKIITHAVGREPYVAYHSDEVEKLLRPYVDILIQNSGGMGLLVLDTFLHGGVTGDAFIKGVYAEEQKKVRLQVQESHLVDPYYNIVDNSIYRPDLVTIDSFITSRTISPTGDIEQKLQQYREVWDKDNLTVFIDSKKDASKSGQNLLGKVPMIHIRNQIAEKNIFGISDVEDLKSLNLLLNSAIRSFQDTVDYMGDPWMLGFGFKMKEVDKHGGRTLSGLPETGRMEFLELKTDMPATLKWIDMLNTGIHEQGGVPINSSTGNEHMSNVSGTAYHYDMYPITEAVDRKLLTYKPGISEAISMGLELMYMVAKKYKSVPFSGILDIPKKIEELYASSGNPAVTSLPWNHTAVEFHDYLQKDEITRTQNVIQKYNAKLLSRKTSMKELGVQNIEQEEAWILEEIEEEEKMKNEMLFTFDGNSGKDNKSTSGTNEIKSPTELSSSPKDKEANDTVRTIKKEAKKNERKDS